jgi:hypothetical protein
MDKKQETAYTNIILIWFPAIATAGFQRLQRWS